MLVYYRNVILFLVLWSSAFYVASAHAGTGWGSDTRIKKDISYGVDRLQKLDIYLPLGARAKKRPVHIFVHGGAWRIGDKKRFSKHAKLNTDNGIIFVSINYRLSPKVKHPAHVEDCARAVKWVYDNIGAYGGDINRIHISGHSAGAHLVALLGTQSKYLRSYGLPPSILKIVIPVDTASFDFTTPPKGSGARFLPRVIAKTFGTGEVQLKAASPLFHVNSKNAPRFMMFVTSERADAVAQTTVFNKALLDAGTRSTMQIIQGLSHSEMSKAMANPKSPIAQGILKAILN
ncbi:MAG: hypothetical protein COA45_04860 [Zetaproteobacteria bacterium]|nr:MAG: hypothetical protein COA45_04860 [Zetaproteobacteria bacterium]